MFKVNCDAITPYDIALVFKNLSSSQTHSSVIYDELMIKKYHGEIKKMSLEKYDLKVFQFIIIWVIMILFYIIKHSHQLKHYKNWMFHFDFSLNKSNLLITNMFHCFSIVCGM
jgi:hypothetical protein